MKFFAPLAAILLLSSCGKPPDTVVGKWRLDAPRGEIQTEFIFNKDGTVTRMDRPSSPQFQARETAGKYTVAGKEIKVNMAGGASYSGSISKGDLTLRGAKEDLRLVK